MITKGRFAVQTALSFLVTGFCMFMLANSKGADKAVYLAQISTVFGLWMQAPGGEKQDKKSDSTPVSTHNISEVESIESHDIKSEQDNHE